METQKEIVDRVVRCFSSPTAQDIIDNCDLAEFWRAKYLAEREETQELLADLLKNFSEIRVDILSLIEENEALSNVYEELELNLKEQR